MRKIVIAGGTGFIGSYLVERFRAYGFHVEIISRSGNGVNWNEKELLSVLEGAEVVLNLAGKNVNCRLSPINKEAIINSRVDSTILIGNAIEQCQQPPLLWINASGTGIYDSAVKYPATEIKYARSNSFLAEVVDVWEGTFFKYKLPATRQVALRTSVVLGTNGGALEPLTRLSKWFLGGTQGSGKQMMSWIHIEDYFRILLFLMEKASLKGVVNCSSPKPVSNKLFMYTLRRKLKRSFGLPAPAFAIKIAARIIGVDSGLILDSSHVKPEKLLSEGYQFVYPTLDLALTDLLRST
ncbi:MAG: hypothetical protein RIS29_420 [Bacteroidota bacterium]|jgi:uncharacterized protein (TIGR01777 family)